MASQWWKQFGSSNAAKFFTLTCLVEQTVKLAYVGTGLAGDISRDFKRPFRNLRARLHNRWSIPVIDDVPTDIPLPSLVACEGFTNWSRVFGHRRDEPDYKDQFLSKKHKSVSKPLTTPTGYDDNGDDQLKSESIMF